jgi:dihydroorotate dehydrogenase electron transfer subunit
MSVDIENATFDLLYKIVGTGTRQLSKRKIGDVLSIIGPIGNGFELTDKKRPLLIGGGVGMPPMIAIAQQIKDKDCQDTVICTNCPGLVALAMLSDAKVKIY